jgi:hypothetical protein
MSIGNLCPLASASQIMQPKSFQKEQMDVLHLYSGVVRKNSVAAHEATDLERLLARPAYEAPDFDRLLAHIARETTDFDRLLARP